MHQRLENREGLPGIITLFPEPPAKIRDGIDAFYHRIYPDQTHRGVIGQMNVFGQYPELQKEAIARLSWQDLQNFQKKEFEPVTILGIFLEYGCATQDAGTGKITITKKVPDGNEEKQHIIDCLLAVQDDDHWVVGGIRRPTAEEILAHVR